MSFRENVSRLHLRANRWPRRNEIPRLYPVCKLVRFDETVKNV